MSLIQGIKADDVEIVKEALEKDKRSFYKLSKKYSNFPFDIAVALDSTNVVSFFLNNAKKYDLRINESITYKKNINSVVSVYSLVKSVEMAEILYSHGIKIIKGSEESEHIFVSQLLKNWTNKDLHKIIHWLLKKGVSPNLLNNNGWSPGWSPLMHAASIKNKKIVTLLLEYGAEVHYTFLNKTVFDLLLPEDILDVILKYCTEISNSDILSISKTNPDMLSTHSFFSPYYERFDELGLSDLLPKNIKNMFIF